MHAAHGMSSFPTTAGHSEVGSLAEEFEMCILSPTTPHLAAPSCSLLSLQHLKLIFKKSTCPVPCEALVCILEM